MKTSELTLLSIAVALFGFFANHRLQLARSRSAEYRKASAQFLEAFESALQRIRAGQSLNNIILEEYPKHDLAKSRFIANLDGKCESEFNKRWMEYEGVYKSLKALGFTAYVAAIIPSSASPVSLKDIKRYENERTRHVLGLIGEILEIVKSKNGS